MAVCHLSFYLATSQLNPDSGHTVRCKLFALMTPESQPSRQWYYWWFIATFFMIKTGGRSLIFCPLICTTIGLLLWHQTRQQWIGKRRRNSQGQQSQEPKIRLVARVSLFFIRNGYGLEFSLHWPKYFLDVVVLVMWNTFLTSCLEMNQFWFLPLFELSFEIPQKLWYIVVIDDMLFI